MNSMPLSFVCGGFHLGHPADPWPLPSPRATGPLAAQLAAAVQQGHLLWPRTFRSRAAALACRELLPPGECPALHGLYLPVDEVARMLDEDGGNQGGDELPVLQLLRAGTAVTAPAAATAGWDVLGFATDQCWCWLRYRQARAVAATLRIRESVDGLIGDGSAALAMCDELNGDELGAPVIWRRWWRTIEG